MSDTPETLGASTLNGVPTQDKSETHDQKGARVPPRARSWVPLSTMTYASQQFRLIGVASHTHAVVTQRGAT